MIAWRTVGTSELDAPTLARIRALLDEAFAGDFSNLDWTHALGGRHVLAWQDGQPLAHGALVPRRLLHQARSLRAGYVEALGVAPGWRKRGIGRAVMQRLEAELQAGYALGALSASDAGTRFYEALGWTRWEGPTSVLTANGIVRTPGDDGSVYVRPLATTLDRRGELTCEWRAGDVW
ncbi:MAG: GNAT family N-acetyltransferase [Myxococcaceae bacterium]